MPNWCYNIIYVYGSKEDLLKFKEDVRSEKYVFDFNKVISFDKHKEKFRKDVWEKDENLRKKHKDEFEMGWFNEGKGYEWCNKNWGTKWRVDCEEPETTDTHLFYSFSSAWYIPIEVYFKLIKTYKNLRFEINYEESGMGFAGDLIGENGEVVSHEEYDIVSYECQECGYLGDVRADDIKDVKCEDCGTKINMEQNKGDE